jgi:hypothetical protein
MSVVDAVSSGGGTGGAQEVIDGNGNVVGTLVGITNVTAKGERLDVQIGQRVWRVNAADGSLVPTGSASTDSLPFWTTDSCSGTPYLSIGTEPVTRPAGIPYAPVVVAFRGSVHAYDVPTDLTTKVYIGGSGDYFLGFGTTCGGQGSGDDRYGTTALTPITLPTFVPPLTIG